MHLTIRLFGRDLLEISTEPAVEPAAEEYAETIGDCTTYPIGFAPTPDVRWETGVGDGEL